MIANPIFASRLTLTGTVLALSNAIPANALTFNWSFEIAPGSTGNIGETVSGTISGLVEGNNPGTGLTVTVDSTPTNELIGGGWSFLSSSIGGPAFTVTGGVITFADAAFTRNNDNERVLFGGFGGYFPTLNDLFDSQPFWTTSLSNTFTPATTPTGTPEPGSVVALLGLGALSLAGRKLRK
ncbi:PEP-CTERM sorting domain-containing protein [Pannus brasiliensis CCIBt3594]|uniref:PEP-CTERM sorting domain-containing protein n=1 Tax=Pannus brasiliensis CCIBt3594 TaxID=1427578 RepID=A0AAW9QT89_9CHRO